MDKNIQQAIHDYYNYGSSQLSDAEFDELNVDRPVGGKTTGNFKKVRHSVPMLSLKNAFTAEEVVKAVPVASLIAEPKFDGLSLSVVYKDGKLVLAKTRGDGSFGDDVTENALRVLGVNHVISFQGEVEVRGEVVMTKSCFEAVNAKLAEEGEQLYSNPRNLAAGTMKSKDSSVVSERGLSFYAYDILGVDLPSIKRRSDNLLMLASLGFIVDTRQLVSGVEQVAEVIAGYAKYAETLDYEIDGIVFKANRLDECAKLGNSEKYPNWAVAYKFPVKKTVATIESISVRVGRQGTLAPVAHISPVVIGGAVVRRATLCNIEEIERLGINVGSKVHVARAAEVIPKIYKCEEPSKETWKMPTQCPSCNGPVVKDGAHTFCHNNGCPEQVVGRIQHAVSKGALNISGCGPAMVQQLVRYNNVKNVSDLYGLYLKGIKTDKGDDASVQAKKTLKGIDSSYDQPLWRKLYALGIDLVGQSKCKELAHRFQQDINEVLGASVSELVEVLGPVAAENFSRYVANNFDELYNLGEAGYWFSKVAKPTKMSCATGKQFVITGGLTTGSRGSVQALIESHGGMCKGGVTRKTDFLVVGEAPGEGKTSAAKKYGTKTIDEETLYSILGMPMPESKSFESGDL